MEQKFLDIFQNTNYFLFSCFKKIDSSLINEESSNHGIAVTTYWQYLQKPTDSFLQALGYMHEICFYFYPQGENEQIFMYVKPANGPQILMYQGIDAADAIKKLMTFMQVALIKG